MRVKGNYYTKTVEFFDINYQLAQNEDKTAIFEGYCDFLNYFDSAIKFQLSFVNRYGNLEDFTKVTDLPLRGDEYDSVRQEYSTMLKNQLTKGNNGLLKTKYITFGIDAENRAIAKTRLERIEIDIISHFKAMSVYARPLDGYERLKLMYYAMRPNCADKFRFNWDLCSSTGLSPKDFIAPSSFTFYKDGKHFAVGEKLGTSSFLQILAPELNDRMLADFLNLEHSQLINFHVQSIDQAKAIKMVKGKLSDIDKMKIDMQKKANNTGYDMDILPADLRTYGQEAQSLLEDLQSRNERMFLVTVVLTTFADTKRQLDDNIFQAAGIALKHNCKLEKLDYQQEQGLITSLPIGYNSVPIERGLTTSALAIFVPFTTRELFMRGQSCYYGLNALSYNMIMADRTKLKNPNGLILGTPGSGKSFTAKREIADIFFRTINDIILCDPEGEYFPLVERLGGTVIKVSPTSKHYINPMDIRLEYSQEENPLILKSDFILSLCDLIIGGKDGLQPIEKTVIDRCIHLVYREYLKNPVPENMPILQDLWELLKTQPESEAKRLASALELYVVGSLNVFNNRTNIDIDNRIVCFDIKELGKELKKIGMLIVQDAVWNRVTINRALGKSTNYYVDEFHLLLKEPQTAAYMVEIWKRFRKWGGIPTGITQNIKDLLSSREIENIFENSDFIIMLNQASGDREILAKALSISQHQLSYVTNSNEGEGLIFYGDVVIPFIDKFPSNLELYRIMTTKPNEINV